jgi:hypothetical protein
LAPKPSGPAANRALFDRLRIGDTVVIQNSFPGWEDELAEVTEKYEDGQVNIRLRNGKTGSIPLKRLASTLSPETSDGCGLSHGTRLCKGDKVLYPARSATLELPEVPVRHVFENGTVVVNDGADFILDLPQVGKAVVCSPQKESICEGDFVKAEGYKLDQPVSFSGPVEKAYTHGVVMVRSGQWRFPIDVMGVSERTAGGGRAPASLPSPDGGAKAKVSPEIEPLDAGLADQIQRGR